MADWAKVGHGMRRRAGLPSSSYETAGASMSRSHYTADEVYELAHQHGSSRIPMGDDAYMGAGQNDEFSPEQFSGTLVPKQNVQSMDPSAQPLAPRQNIERIGATYRIEAGIPGTMDPTLGPTQAGGRIIPSVMGRQAPNFYGGEQDSYL